ncbi:SIMPL domain-containing protein [Halorientalis pallida]|uniref:SIMPL domain-containing protein n=1 Tax=Halorientalis pallida TaxID=2479928 RepID=UPI003C6EAE8C
MRKTIALALAAAVVLTVGAAGTVLAMGGTGTQPAQTAADTGGQTITVSGDGSASAQPDQAVLRFAVTAEGDDPAAIRSELASGASDLRSALSEAGVADDAIETTGYSIEEPPRRVPPGRDGGETGPELRGVHVFEVTLDDTDRAGAVVDAAAGAGAEVQSVQFTLAADTREDLRNQALENAMENARGQADTLASAGGLSVTGVASIDATGTNYRPVAYDAERAQAASGGTAIETGDVSVSTSVRVVYEASDQ